MPKKLKITLFTITIVLLGFLRGYLFYNINWIYKTITVNRRNQAREEFHFLLDWSASEILLLKWVLTFLFLGLFFWLTYIIIKIAFEKKLHNQIVIAIYLAMIFLAGFLYLIGLLMGEMPSKLYAVIRTVMGIAQSFLPLMILAILFKFLPQIDKE